MSSEVLGRIFLKNFEGENAFTMIGKWLKSYGEMKRSREVDGVFTSFKVIDELNYFYAGSDVMPTGILGLQADYVLRSKFWKPVDLTSAMLEKWVAWMNSDTAVFSAPCGWRIYNRNKDMVGILYAREKVVVKFEKNGSVCVYPPDDIEVENR